MPPRRTTNTSRTSLHKSRVRRPHQRNTPLPGLATIVRRHTRNGYVRSLSLGVQISHLTSHGSRSAPWGSLSRTEPSSLKISSSTQISLFLSMPLGTRISTRSFSQDLTKRSYPATTCATLSCKAARRQWPSTVLGPEELAIIPAMDRCLTRISQSRWDKLRVIILALRIISCLGLRALRVRMYWPLPWR